MCQRPNFWERTGSPGLFQVFSGEAPGANRQARAAEDLFTQFASPLLETRRVGLRLVPRVTVLPASKWARRRLSGNKPLTSNASLRPPPKALEEMI